MMVSHPRFDLVIRAISQFVKETQEDLKSEEKVKEKVEKWIRHNEFHSNFIKAV